MTSTRRSILVSVFLTAFLDLVGFSIIFPLFPQLLEYYVGVEGTASTIGRLAASLRELAGDSANADFLVVVLFGGFLGSLYSVLQFIFAPIWGSVSDRYGRRATLLITLTGTVLSYVGWFFAGRFTILVIARMVGGIMAGNVSTASAVIADVTPPEGRSSGMAIIGVAIGLGFIVGPAIGGAASFVDFTQVWPAGTALGVNPFSTAALVALILGLINLALVFARLEETHPPERRGSGTATRSNNPLVLFIGLNAPGIQRTNLLSFLYLTAFSAMEFTLVFVTVERFGYTPRDNAGVFVFVGLVIALVQGGAVRRLQPKYGDRRLVQFGLLTILPGFLLVGYATGVPVFYVGLFLMATGSAFAMPCLSGLISRYAPESEQGFALGIFRSMGALSRAVGPVLGGVLYWRFGSSSPYAVGAVLIIVPFVLALGLPEPSGVEQNSTPTG